MSLLRTRADAHAATWNAKLGGFPYASFAFHHTALRNAADVLNNGLLVSRAQLAELGLLHEDAASADVISNTDGDRQKFVRLYFRPCTPTQWHCEGIRPESGFTAHRAHCPVPVFFLFDLPDLLTRQGTHFSDGNMASTRVSWGNTQAVFDAIPFGNVYHRGWASSAPDPANVVFNRHAEFWFPMRCWPPT